MAAQYSAGPQTIPAGGSVTFALAPVPCNRGLIYHRAGSGLFRLASPLAMGYRARRQCCTGRVLSAYYPVTFSGNIGLAAGGEAGELSLALLIDDEEDPASVMITQGTAEGEFESVSSSVIVQVPAICPCSSVAVHNVGSQAISLNNGALTFAGVEVRF